MNQTSLPLELSTCIDPNHIVFSIYNFVDSLDDHYFKIFETQDGRPAYHQNHSSCLFFMLTVKVFLVVERLKK
ncbi:hypothetical protein ACF3NG_03290 [Aerococcaceae bacterium WGS1372]